MQKFKPGDRVIYIGVSKPSSNLFKGRPCTVESYLLYSTKYMVLVGIEGAWVEKDFVLDEETFNGNI